MNNTMKRRPYAAPAAELICLAPAAPIATGNGSWTWGDKNSKPSGGKWNDTNHWGASFDIFANASVTGIATWTGEDELSPN